MASTLSKRMSLSEEIPDDKMDVIVGDNKTPKDEKVETDLVNKATVSDNNKENKRNLSPNSEPQSITSLGQAELNGVETTKPQKNTKGQKKDVKENQSELKKKSSTSAPLEISESNEGVKSFSQNILKKHKVRIGKNPRTYYLRDDVIQAISDITQTNNLKSESECLNDFLIETLLPIYEEFKKMQSE